MIPFSVDGLIHPVCFLPCRLILHHSEFHAHLTEQVIQETINIVRGRPSRGKGQNKV